jgi:hypothetical protein
VLIDGRWRVVDTYYGLMFRHNGALATVDDLVRHSTIVTEHPAVQALPDDARREVLQFYLDFIGRLDQRRFVRWGALTEAKYGSVARRATRATLRTLLAITGDWGAFRFQDAYLALLPDRLPAIEPDGGPAYRSRREDAALFMYYQARNYHLFERAAKASALYRRIAAEYPGSLYAERSTYFLGRLTHRLDNDPDAARTILTTFLARYPDSSWTLPAYDVRGRVNEARGDIAAAIADYEHASRDARVPAARHLAALKATSTVRRPPTYATDPEG